MAVAAAPPLPELAGSALAAYREAGMRARGELDASVVISSTAGMASPGATRVRACSTASSADGIHAEGRPRGCLAECRVHFCRCPSRQQLSGSLAFIIVFTAIIVFSATGDLRRAMDHLETLDYLADLILICLFIYTGLPFGYGYTIVAICTG